MPKSLRVLLVEDSPDDADLLLLELRRGGYEVDSRRVDTAEGVATALGEAEWDIVISDYAMPGFSGLDALKLVRSRDADLPFILVSGTIGEDVAVEAMKAGAHDYIMKGNLTRLAPAIERELRETEVRRRREQAEDSLEHEQAYSRAIIASMADALFVISADGAIRTCNGRALDMLGYAREELVGHSMGKLFAMDPGVPEDNLLRIRNGLRRGELRDFDTQLRKHDGETLAVSLSCASLHEGRMAAPEIVLVARDITDRRLLQEKQRNYAEYLAAEAERAREYAEAVLKMSDSHHKLIGKGPAYDEIVSFVCDAAEVPSPVLVLGESGTGKEVVARSIRLNSPRGEKSFVVVDCAALGASLLESELFGHEKGAFTGAHETKAGLIEMADGGTLFVDEIGEMPLELQSKLLRALERGEFRRVGSVETRRADIRVIAATNRDLAKEVEKGRFRTDLYYRLNVLCITLPPLRERREDVPLLARHFLGHSRVTTPNKKHFRQDTLEHLSAYDWPGNIRELGNVIERAVILSRRGDCITPDHLPPEIHKMATRAPAAPNRSRSLAEAEREAIVAALAEVVGNKTKAAAILGISRVTLRDKIQKYGIASTKGGK